MHQQFAGKHVVVTGASRGIGLSVARAFAQSGAEVFILAETKEVDRAAEHINALKCIPVVPLLCDVTDRVGLHAIMSKVARIDVLIANAGIGDMTPVSGPAPEVDEIFERLIRVNLVGAFNTVRAALPHMRADGRIVFTSSVHGQGIAPPGMGGYTASKGGLDALMRSLARELGPRGITVNAVAPGMVATELTLNAVRKLFAAQISTEAPASEAEMIRQLNTGQAIHHEPVDPERLAQAYLFLASAASGAITGQTLNVDHGLSM